MNSKNLFSEAADAVEHETFVTSKEGLVLRLRTAALEGSEFQGVIGPERIIEVLNVVIEDLRERGFSMETSAMLTSSAIVVTHQAGLGRERFLKGVTFLWDDAERRAREESEEKQRNLS